MKLVGTEVGRFTMLFPAEEIRPLQGVQPSAVISAIKDRYSFQYSPDFAQPWEIIQRDGLIFKLGKILIEGKDASITELGVYSDGVVVTAFTTEVAEAFFYDLLDWLKKTFGYRSFAVKPRRIYASQVTVKFDMPVNQFIGKFDEIVTLISSLVSANYGVQLPYEIQSLGLDYDHLPAPSNYDLVRFLIERRVKTSYEEGIFWCQAPLPTLVHVEALEAFEKIINATKSHKK